MKNIQGDQSQQHSSGVATECLSPTQEQGLLSCPKGCAARVLVYYLPDSESRHFYCEKCRWTAPWGDTNEEARQEWNTRAPQWQSIETAPKDEVWSNGRHIHGPLILAHPVWGKVDTVYWWQTADGRASNFLDGGGNAVHPTHWQPLPVAPEVNEPARNAEITTDS